MDENTILLSFFVLDIGPSLDTKNKSMIQVNRSFKKEHGSHNSMSLLSLGCLRELQNDLCLLKLKMTLNQ